MNFYYGWIDVNILLWINGSFSGKEWKDWRWNPLLRMEKVSDLPKKLALQKKLFFSAVIFTPP